MALPDDFLQELRLRNDITQVASGYVNLKRRGRNMVGLCPFHNEKTASFNIYPETDSFYCFGCGAGGDVITFISRVENLDYIDSVKLLAQRVGMEMPDDTYDDSMQKLRLRIYEANREAARYFYSCLYSSVGKKGLDYLYQRQLSDSTIRSFGLGFAPDSWSSLTDFLIKEKGFRPSELTQANLSMTSKNGGLIDRFRNRVMFPIIDVRGNVVAFGGRIMTDEKPKYLNTSDTPAFKKSNNLFALNRAKNSKSDRLILCEGYMDVIALHQAGFDFAIATLGTALTQEQAVIIKRYTGNVVICYDADEAGQKATSRAIDILRKEGLSIKVLTIPDGKDPDEFIKRHGENGRIKFKQLLDGTGSDIEYEISKIRQNYNLQTAQGKSAFMNEAARFLSKLDNQIDRDIYAAELCQNYDVDRKSFDDRLNYLLRNRFKKEDKAELGRISRQLAGESDRLAKNTGGSLRAVRAEEALIAYLMLNPDMVRRVYSELPAEKITSEFNRRVYSAVTQRALSNRGVALTDISGEFSQEENARIASFLAHNMVETNSPKVCFDYVGIILEEGSRQSAQEIAGQSNEEIKKYITELGAMRKKNKK